MPQSPFSNWHMGAGGGGGWQCRALRAPSSQGPCTHRLGPPSPAARLWERRVTGQHRRSDFKSFLPRLGKTLMIK